MEVDTLRITVEEAGTFVIPAYTREREDFERVVGEHLASYGSQTEVAGCLSSVGDFALYLLGKASQEPRQIEKVRK